MKAQDLITQTLNLRNMAKHKPVFRLRTSIRTIETGQNLI